MRKLATIQKVQALHDIKEADFYNFYKKNSKNPVERKVFGEFSKKLGNGIVRLVTFDGVEVIFPWRLGTLYLKRRETKVYKTYFSSGQRNDFRGFWN